MKSSDYKETKLITEIATQIIEDPSTLIEKYFNSSLKNLLKFNTKFGTIAHICVYLREAEYLRKLICRFDEPRNLYQWLSEKDSFGNTAIELATNFDFEEMNILFEKVIKNEISPKNTEIILKEAVLDKYTNIMNGYKQRLVKLTTESLIYSKKDEQENVKIFLKELKLEYTEDHKKIRLINLSNENEFVFKDVNRGPLSSWINILKNIMPNRDRTFYFNAFFYRLLSDLVKNLDENVYEIMKLNENLTYYMTQNNNLPTESSFSVTNNPIEQKINLEEENKPEQIKLKENEILENKFLEENKEKNEQDLKNSLTNLNINETKPGKNEEIEMFSFESDTEEKYQFYEAKE